MDFEDSFPSAPVRYALDDVDSDEEYEASQVQVQPFQLNLEAQIPENATLIIGLVGAGSAFVQAIEGIQAIGTMTQSSIVKADLYLVHHLVFVALKCDIDNAEAGSFTRAIYQLQSQHIERVILLDAFTSFEYTSEVYGDDLTPPFLRVLQTTTAPVINGFVPFESPNLIKGLASALINYCEIRSIPCYNMRSLQESLYGKLLVTPETLAAYTQGLSKLRLSVTLNEDKLKNTHINDSHHRLYL
ncbi:hypothetical protein K501DRAFT_278362 [Backusella circina FSU 941]|nr:hypothetical protein K501DRAFT_278362 [Backusella circina FSU 941]